jgi:hypothetical protein
VSPVTPELRLPVPLPGGGVELRPHTMREPVRWPVPAAPPSSRVAYAAAHVVARPAGDTAPGAPADLDWDATLRFRHHLWSCGLGVAEAMDTAQRGMGLDWDATRELIRRTAAEARVTGGALVVGVGTDHVPGAASLDDVVRAYTEQLEVADAAGARPVLMASRHLARLATGPEDYAKVYGRLLEQVSGPVLLHWLGTPFDPALEGYWGSTDLDAAAEALLAILREHAAVVDGVKVSLLDAAREVALRLALPAGVRLYTGDDFDYPDLVLGDDHGHSDALLGILDAIAPAAAAALQALDAGDVAGYRAAFEPTVPLARHVFAAPTPAYKTGLVFLAWLAGHQDGFAMVGGRTSDRGAVHLSETFRLADAAGLLPDPDLAAARMRAFLTVAGLA